MKRYIEEVIIALYLILIALMVWGIWHYWIDSPEFDPTRDNPAHQVIGHTNTNAL